MSALPLGEAAGAAAAMCWAIGSLLFERLGGSRATSAGALNLGKSGLATVVLGGIALAVHGGTLVPEGAAHRDLLWLLASGVIGIAIGDTCFFGAILDVGAARAILLLSTAPLFVLGIEIARSRDLPPFRDLIGVALSLAGVAVVMLRRPEVLDARPRRPVRGLVLGALSGLCQAVGSLMSREATRGTLDPLSASFLRLASAVAVLAIAALVTGKLLGWTRELRVPGTFPRIGGATMIGTVCGLWLSQIALARSASVGVAATLLATSPVFAIPLAHVSGAERITRIAFVGTVVAFLGIAVLTLH